MQNAGQANPGVAPVNPAANLGAALQDHSRIKRSTDLPWYFGIPSKESISAANLIERLEMAAGVANWDTDDKKIREFYLLLRDEALVWWKSLKRAEGVDKTVWDQVKAAFLLQYEPRITARTTCTNLADLNQRPNEVSNRYYLRLFATFDKLQESYPEDRHDVRFVPANAAAATADEQKKIKREGFEDAFKFIEHQQYLAGLRDPLRTEVMKAGKPNVTESLKYAAELEAIAQKNTLTALTRGIAACQMEDDDEAGIEEDELEIINAIRRRSGKPPLKSGHNFRGHNNNSGNSNNAVTCRYCKKKGHMQKECKKRQRDKAPMVDVNGKPFTKNNVHAVDAEDNGGHTDISSVVIADQKAGLNWF